MSTDRPLKIGFMLPSNYSLAGPGNGVRAQAVYQANALERLGHEVSRLEPWTFNPNIPQLDVVQFFLGGYANYTIEVNRPHPVKMLVFAPIIDSNEPMWRYRLAAMVGAVTHKVNTAPAVMRDQALNSNLVICRSSHERERVIRGLGVDPSKVGIEIVLNGVDLPAQSDPGLARSTLQLPGEFALHVSQYTQRRKNVLRLIEAVGPTGIPLVIAGYAPPGPDLERVRAASKRYPTIQLLGALDRNVLDSLYAACKVFCLPSVHEGTGLVALEAASHGARVVITQHGGPPDYFLDMAEYVNPDHVDDIRHAVVRAWEAPDSTRLKDHVLQNLTWEHSAEALAAAYRRHAPS